ncbi:Hypothetical predicted protein [Paramuricea clavata]|nr:Hypothetical predicted protein [Paramuricea clavata]
MWNDVFQPLMSPGKPSGELFSCVEKPSRNAGNTPECMYYDRKESLEKENCLYLNGSSYHGNISVTSSGIPCQSWTEQCPHRHTMNKTYPELNNAKNYCRNPQNSGQRPWCFTTDRNKRWEYCDIPKCIPVDGSYGNWSLNSSCSVTCGEGFVTWSRECDNPEPKYGGRNCNHLGEPVEYKPCTKKPCPVNGGYSSWNLSSQCNVTCGQGKEILRRSCNNPTPKNGGRNCTVLGKDVEYRICKKQLCPVDGNYSNWTTSSVCSVTCGVGYQMWFRTCDNPPPKYGGEDCSKYGKDRDSRPCHTEPCPTTSASTKAIKITCGVCVLIIIMVIGLILVRKRKVWIERYHKRSSIPPYAVFQRSIATPCISTFCNASFLQDHFQQSLALCEGITRKWHRTESLDYKVVNILSWAKTATINRASTRFNDYHHKCCSAQHDTPTKKKNVNIISKTKTEEDTTTHYATRRTMFRDLPPHEVWFFIINKLTCVEKKINVDMDSSPVPEWTTNAGVSSEEQFRTHRILADHVTRVFVPQEESPWVRVRVDTAISNCLYLNGSSYHGNISVTASDRTKRWEYSTTCNVTCGEGFGTWSRECNYPEPKYGGRNCSHLGEPVEYRPCSAKPCPVNGGYSNWTLSAPCNVSCGDGVEIWRRFCNNPEPKYGGHNCSGLGNSTVFGNCSRSPCSIDGSYDNWTASPCSATCGQGVEIWIRQCDNPPGKFGGNCSKQGPAQEIRTCKMKPCPVHFDSQMIGISVAAAVVFVIIVTVACLIFILRRRRRKEGFPYYARVEFLRLHPRGSPPPDNTSDEVPSLPQEPGTKYGNTTSEGEPVPGLSRGVVRYPRDYMNTRPARNSWYDRLQLLRPLAMDWLRNAWGNVDEFGRHVYDVMQRVRHVFVPYDKLSNLQQGDSAGSGVERNNTYSTMERPAAVILPTESENASTTENV